MPSILAAMRFTLGLAIALAVGSATEIGHAADQKPLPVPGKTTVYQRVLAKRDTILHASPGGASRDTVRPFQPLYVFARQGDWLQIGLSPTSRPDGWISKDRAIEWHQNIIVSFSTSAGRKRQLMFGTNEDLMAVLRHESPIARARELRRLAVTQGPGAAPGVVAVEPEETVPIEQNFYMFPILDWHDEDHPMSGDLMKVLKVASLPLEDEQRQEAPEEPATVGVVFVIDTSRSMQPYIDATRRAVSSIVERIQRSTVGQYVRFGAIGFRDSVEAALNANPPREIEYRTKVFLRLSSSQTGAQINGAFATIKEATASTVGYHEDAVSGVLEAIHMPEWETAGKDGGPIQQRYIVVISDASPKPQHDPSLPENIRHLGPQEVWQQANNKRITLASIHILTPDGRPNIPMARAAYQSMTPATEGGQQLYFSVDLTRVNTSERDFDPVIGTFSDFIVTEHSRSVEQLRNTQRERQLTALEEASLAMRLRWLGERRNASAPELIEAYTLDVAIENPLVPALDVRLLVTKNQLSTMRDVLAEVVRVGEQTQGELRENEFFERLRGALAQMAQNPGSLVNTRFETLGQAVGEFLDGLPYRSQILDTITPEQWMNLGPRRREVLDRIAAKQQQYEHFAANDRLWTKLYPEAPDGERVYAMPLSSLP